VPPAGAESDGTEFVELPSVLWGTPGEYRVEVEETSGCKLRISLSDQQPTIVLFFTGPFHAGENLRTLLEQRLEELGPPKHMCDALSRNLPAGFQTVLGNCLGHARRNFVDVVDAFPQEVRYVLECLREVYRTDAAARRFKLSDEQRMRLHQRRSQPVMNMLHGWLSEQLEQRHVEPNSSLGKAMNYMLNHWEKLTGFLHVPGMPLDNNICERVLKMSIRHRKNSLFYKTQNGAKHGDVYMSLIFSCHQAGVDPHHYLTEVQRHEEQVKAAPARWLPWNYREQLAE